MIARIFCLQPRPAMKTAASSRAALKAAGKTKEDVCAELIAHGITQTQWAKDHCYPRSLVADLLTGRIVGNAGEAHRCAVDLGIKAEPGPLPRNLKNPLFKDMP